MSQADDWIPPRCYLRVDPERKSPEPKSKRRRCRKCDAEFDSYFGNRTCDDCRMEANGYGVADGGADL